MKNPKVGNVVRLKSGGFNMSIESVGENTTGVTPIKCVWFDFGGNLKRDSFDKKTLSVCKCQRKKNKDKKKK